MLLVLSSYSVTTVSVEEEALAPTDRQVKEGEEAEKTDLTVNEP
jgi:hypothetical protein